MAKILVIDDHPLIRVFLQDALGDAGHVVTAVPDGRAGLATAEEAAPEVVVLDYRMPGMSGPAVLRALKTRYPTLPVFFFTVCGDFVSLPGVGEADGCLVKSADLTPLLAAIAGVTCVAAQTIAVGS